MELGRFNFRESLKTDVSKQTAAEFFYATESLLPAIEAIFAHAIEPRRRVHAHSFGQGGKALHHEGNGRFQLGNGGMAGFGKRPCTGGTIVQGPGFAALNRVGALGLDALPITIGTSPGGQCHSLLLTTRICLCGGA